MLLTKTIQAAAKKFPKKTAILDEKGSLTYEELYHNIVQLAKSLQQMGVQKGDRVALLTNNNYHVIEIKYATLLIGAIYVPISTRLAWPELHFILNNADPKCLFMDESFIQEVVKIKEETKIEHFISLVDQANEDEQHLTPYTALFSTTEPLTEVKLDENDVAGIYYTGGTTGLPKGVMLTHKNLVSNVYHTLAHTHFTERNRYLHISPMFHLAGSVTIFLFVTVGATHAVLPKFDPVALLETIERYKITHMTMVPTTINMLVNHPQAKDYDLSSLQLVRYGASPMPFEVLEKAYEVLQCEFSANYGMTETSPVLANLNVTDHAEGLQSNDEKLRKRLTSVGRQVVGVEVKIVDDQGNELPPHEVGEIIARGPNVMKGYWKNEAETNKVLIDGWYHTGDMGYYDEDWYIYLVDRKKDMIITGGLNVYSIEVENAIYENPEVLETAVIGVPDEKWIEAVKAFVVLKDGTTLTEQQLIERLRKILADYKVPKIITFVDELPKSPAGKILKRELRKFT